MMSETDKPFMFSVINNYADCRYADCRYTDCRGAV